MRWWLLALAVCSCGNQRGCSSPPNANDSAVSTALSPSVSADVVAVDVAPPPPVLPAPVRGRLAETVGEQRCEFGEGATVHVNADRPLYTLRPSELRTRAYAWARSNGRAAIVLEITEGEDEATYVCEEAAQDGALVEIDTPTSAWTQLRVYVGSRFAETGPFVAGLRAEGMPTATERPEAIAPPLPDEVRVRFRLRERADCSGENDPCGDRDVLLEGALTQVLSSPIGYVQTRCEASISERNGRVTFGYACNGNGFDTTNAEFPSRTQLRVTESHESDGSCGNAPCPTHTRTVHRIPLPANVRVVPHPLGVFQYATP